jgi:hypothetical protein
MTAPVGRNVKRTFSEGGRFPAGLPRQKTLKGDRENFGDFSQPFLCVQLAKAGVEIGGGHHSFPKLGTD